MKTKNIEKKRSRRIEMDKHKREEKRYKELIPYRLFFRMSLAVICFMLVFAGVGVVSATDYYVAPWGDDGDNGLSLDHAWATIQHAANTVSAGDTVLVQSGTYNENVVQSTDGTSDNRIVFQGVGNPVIDAGGGTGFKIYGDYVTVTGFYIKNADWGIQAYQTDYVNISYNTMDDFSCDRGIRVEGYEGSSQNILNATIEHNVIKTRYACIRIVYGFYGGSISYNNLTAQSQSESPLAPVGYSFSDGSQDPPAYGWVYYMNVIGNTIRGGRNGLGGGPWYHCHIADNNVKDYAHNGINLHCTQYSLIENNWIGASIPNPSEGSTNAYYNDGSTNRWRGNTFRNNYCEDAQSRGFAMDNGDDGIVEDFTSVRSGGPGIDMHCSQGYPFSGVSGNWTYKNITIDTEGSWAISFSKVSGDYRFTNVALSGFTGAGWRFDGEVDAVVHVINSNKTSTSWWWQATGGEFRFYYPLDVKVEDTNGKPVEGATVTITNDVDSNYPSINYKWENKTTFTTGADGHTALPNDEEDSAAIMDFRETRAGKTYMSYTVTAEKDGYSNSTTVNPDETWYREDPDTYPGEGKGTIVITLPTTVETGAISGTVTNSSNGAPIKDARVEAGAWYNDTDDNGNYTIPNIPAGTYTVTASKEGYKSVSKEVTVRANETVMLNFTLFASHNDTVPPIITILSPKNGTYDTKMIPLNFTANEPLNACVLSVDATANQTLQTCQNLSVISREYEERAGTVGWWHFNGNAYDYSGNGNNGTINGASFVHGKFGEALKFDGIDDWVEVKDPTMEGNEITIEAWIYLNNITGEYSIVNKYVYAGANERSYILTVEDGVIWFGLSSDGTRSNTTFLNSSKKIMNNTWTHITAISDGKTMKIFINGVQDPSTKPAPAEIHDSPYDLYIGRWMYSTEGAEGDWTYAFDGIIDEIRILNRALSEEEIESDYALGKGRHSVTVYGNDTAGNWNSSSVCFSIQLEDITPPASIYNLENRSGATWINWTWTNPSDSDFAYTMVYLNGVFKTNTSNSHYNATGLVANTTHEIGTHTVDTNGNVNATWVNRTAKTLAVTNSPPYKPGNPSPADGAVNIPIDIDLSWTGGDPDAGDTVTYDVYFGTDSNPPMVSNDQLETTYDPGTLNYSTLYYWRIVAKDEHGASNESEVWTFITASASGSDLVGLWPFDEGEGATAGDSSGNGNNGTIHGATWAIGKLGSGLKFDGENDYINIPNSPSLNPENEITIIAWVNPGVIPQSGWNKIIAKPYTNYTSPWQQYALTLRDSHFVFELNTEGKKDVIASTETLEPNTWYHVAGTYNGSEMSIYVNGELNGALPKSGVIARYPTDVHIGAGIYGDAQVEYINGTIDEVKIYNRALTADEIQADYERGLKDTTPPVSIYNLENRSSATWINWTWTNPSDNDFAYTMVYLDGVFKTNTSNSYYNATGLVANTTYEIGTHTVDTNGNINTTWVNQTAKTTLLLLPFPGCDNPPTDQDGDGIYEDINGNNELGFADVVIFTTNIEWIRDNEPIEHFDFNMDGKIDDNDLNILSEKVEGGR